MIFLGAERLMYHRNVTNDEPAGASLWEDEVLDSDLQACLEALRNMQGINNLAKSYLNLLDSGENNEFHILLP
jgi:hypothetical protein